MNVWICLELRAFALIGMADFASLLRRGNYGYEGRIVAYGYDGLIGMVIIINKL